MKGKRSPISIITFILIMVALAAGVVELQLAGQWIAGIIGVLLLTMLILNARFYPPGGNFLLLGLTLLMLAGAALVRSQTTIAPTIPDDVPEEVLELPVAADTLPTDVDRFVLFYTPDEDTVLEVEFERVDTLEGHWAYERARINGEDELDGTFHAVEREREPDWDETIYTNDDPTRAVTPSFSVELPFDEDMVHEEIEVQAVMTITYPVPMGDDAYDIEQRRLTRNLTFFVATPEEGILRQQMDTFSTARGANTTILVAFGGGGLLLTLLGLGRLVASGGYGMLAPQLLGKLGMVIADTQLLAAQMKQTLPPGVIVVGKVRPSSPAEKAGIFPGDIITEVDNERFETHRRIKSLAGKWRKGDQHTFTILRGDQTMQVWIDV